MDLVRSLKISTCIVLLVALVWGVCALNAIRNMSQIYGADTYQSARTLELAGEIDAAKAEMYVAQRGAIVATFMGDAARADAMRRDFEAHSAVVRSAFAQLEGLMDNPDDKRYLARIQSDFDGWQREHGKVVLLCRAGDAKAAERHSSVAITPLYEDLTQTTAQWEQFNRQVLAARALSTADQQALWVGVFMVLMFGTCMGCFLYMSNRIAAQQPTTVTDSDASVVPWLLPEI
jgi:hypothetical protein